VVRRTLEDLLIVQNGILVLAELDVGVSDVSGDLIPTLVGAYLIYLEVEGRMSSAILYILIATAYFC
jgi:hypothetical protein